MRRPTRPFIAFLLLAASCGSPQVTEEMPLVFYPEPPDPPRIQFLRSVSVGGDIEVGRSGLDTLLFGESDREKGLMAPYGTAVRDGIVYICDIQQGVVLTLDFAQMKLDWLRTDGRGVLQKPVNLVFSEDGTLYVADLGRRQVVVYSSDFKYMREYGPFGENSKPVDVELVGDRLYIVDAGNADVRVMDAHSSKEILHFGQDEEAAVKHTAPTNLSVDNDGNCYVVDSVLCQVFVWDKDGNFVRHIGSPGDVVGQFARPKGIALDGDKLYVVDASFENCQILDLDGEPLLFFGGSGVGPGNLYLPAGVWVGSDGLQFFQQQLDDDFEAEKLIIVTNLFGPYKMNFYALGKSKLFDYSAPPPEDDSVQAETASAAVPPDSGQ